MTITGVDNHVHEPDEDRKVAVRAAVSGGRGVVAPPPGRTLTLDDDDTLPVATLVLSANSISENGGIATVGARLSGGSSRAVTITVSAAPGANTEAGDFTLSTATTLTIAAGATTSTGRVAIVAVDDAVGGAAKQVRVTATAAGGNGVAAPAGVTLAVTDDDGVPQVVLALSPSAIDESGADNVATVTATLSRASRAAVTVTVSASPVASTGAEADDFTLSTTTTLTIAAGAATSTGTVTITAADDAVDAPDRQVSVSGAAASGRTIVQPAAVTLTVTDDEATPTVTLALSAASVSESGGVATVTAALDHASSEATTITVSASPVASTGATAGDFTLGADRTLTVAAGATTSAGTVTITARPNPVDAPDKQVAVSGAASNAQGIAQPAGRTVTLADDDDPPTLTLHLSRTSIEEDVRSPAGERRTVVSARLSHGSHAAVTVTVSAAAGTNAAADDFDLSANKTLVVAAGATASTGTVTIAAADDDVDSVVDTMVAGKRVVVSGASSGASDPAVGVASPGQANLLIVEDDAAGLALVPVLPADPADPWLTVAEDGTDTFTVALSSEPTAAVTVTVTSGDGGEGEVSTGAGTPAASATLAFSTSDWRTAQTVTLSGVTDGTVDGAVVYQLTLDPAGVR